MMLELLLMSVAMTSALPDQIHLMGRMDRRESVPRSAWPGTGVALKFVGQKIEADISSNGDDYVQIELDGVPTSALHLKPETKTYYINLATNGSHQVRLIKRTEAFVGTTTWADFRTDGSFSKPVIPTRRLEIVGDSISCGYGNRGADRTLHFAADTEDAYQTYGSIAGRAVNAETWITAWSGKKMWPDNDIPSLYDRAIPTDVMSKWDFVEDKPDAFVINLATNDFGGGNPAEAGWTDAYAKFIARLQARAPKAMIYCATGSMMSDNYPPNNKALTTLKGYLDRMVARLSDPKVRRIDFDPQTEEDGIGADWHPSVKTHQKMADRLTETLRRDLGW